MDEKHVKKKLDEQLLKKLHSGDEELILKALSQLRSSGNLGYLQVLFEILNNSKNESLHREMAKFFADIKKTEAIPLFIKGLENPELLGIRMAVTSACWQSGMDYSAHLDLFIDIFLESDYMTSLESFSVIEQSLENITGDEIRQKGERILQELGNLSEDKKPLARELIGLMQI